MRNRRLVAVAVAVTTASVTATLTGCDGGGTVDGSAASPSITLPPSGAPPAPTSPPPSPSPPASPSPSPSVSSSAPLGITPPGTELLMGEAAVLSLPGAGADGGDLTVLITPQAVEQGDIADFEGFEVAEEHTDDTPYYVTVGYELLAGEPSEEPELSNPLAAATGEGDAAAKVSLLGSLPACADDPAEGWTEDGTRTECEVFFVGSGERVASLLWYAAPDTAPVTWRLEQE
ncbi:hypothetical protein [Allostreptomyces psammosilenae]|uniref:Uncharacterized protein n=1 Tax=Allostreptomyces psammosilenae TaxID=1892865 RepID=A0A852ZWK2_9ACTN|nr:hypothetical protein [Allostreptomyces psammosilenae]NYI06773.1 hypothetical protein [Allostreptomyces psammosilenae]